MEPEASAEPQLAHVLFMDIVGSSQLPSDEQKRIVGRLQDLVRDSAEFQRARADDRLISLPTGDGMALVFFDKLDSAVLCAVEITHAIQAESLCRIRMGAHSGPVFVMEDINGKRNVSGAGINRAERVMSCGSQGHILLSDSAAESLRHLSAWRDKIVEVGECQTKDGWVRVWNLVDGPIGNPAPPKKSKRSLRRRRLAFVSGAALTAMLAVVAAVASGFWLGRSGKNAQFPPDKASIAVLPFTDLSPEKNQEYFSDGLAEQLLNGLAKIPALRVAGRTSSFWFKNKTVDCRTMGAKLNVATLLEGSVRKQGNRARIAVQLIKAADGFELWSESYDREMNDIFAVEEEIARAVTAALKVKLLAEKPAPAAESTNAEAYNAYLQGVYFLERANKENLEKAADYFEQAIELDSRYAPAWVALAEAHISQAGSAYISVDEGFRKARDAVARALALDANSGAAHACLGEIRMLHDWDWTGADESYRRALDIEPGDAGAIRAAGSLARYRGQLDKALALYRRAVAIDPLHANGHKNMGMILYYAGRQDEARLALEKALEFNPGMSFAHALIAQVDLAQGRMQEALAEAVLEKHPISRLVAMALAYHAVGRRKESDASLAELIATYRSEAPYQIAEVSAFRGETDHAFEWLERSYIERDGGLTEVKSDPLLKSLRGDSRYVAFLGKMRLPL